MKNLVDFIIENNSSEDNAKSFGEEIIKYIESSSKTEDENRAQYVYDFTKQLIEYLYNHVAGSVSYSALYDAAKDFVEDNKNEPYKNWRK